MNTSQKFMLVALSLLTAACSATVSGGGGTPPVPPVDEKATSLEGTWGTGCLFYKKTAFVSATFTIHQDKVDTQIVGYRDAGCTMKVSEDFKSGLFKIGAKSTTLPGAYNVDWMLADINGKVETRYDIFFVDGKNLYLGEKPGLTETTRSKNFDVDLIFQKGVGTPPSTTPQPSPTAAPTNCVNLNGKYSNSYIYSVKQDSCSQLTWTRESDGTGSAPLVTTMATDGIERVVSTGADGSKVYEKVYYASNSMYRDVRVLYTDGYETRKTHRYFRDTKPCNLLNPDGKLYLAIETTQNGAVVSCLSYYPIN